MTENELLKKSFEQCAKDEPGTIYADFTDEEYRCLVMRGPVAICAYIGVPKNNPLYEVDYSDENLYGVECHGGLTFADTGSVNTFPQGYWWLGWDYAHLGDLAFYEIGNMVRGYGWSPLDVYNEIPHVLEQIKDLSEDLKRKQEAEEQREKAYLRSVQMESVLKNIVGIIDGLGECDPETISQALDEIREMAELGLPELGLGEVNNDNNA